MTDFKIRRGLSTELFSNGILNPNILLEDGCWYLCTDTVELFVCLYDNNNQLSLKQINHSISNNTASVVDAYIENNELFLAFSDNTTKSIGSLSITDGLTSIKVGDTVFNASGSSVELPEFATTSYVDEKIASIELPEALLDDYATKEFVQEEISKIDIPDVSQFITEIPEEFITASELEAEGFLKEHQPLEDYAKKEELTDFITLSDAEESFATKDYVDTVISNIEIPNVDSFITEETLEAKGFITDISGKSDVGHTHDYSEIVNIPENLATKDFVAEEISKIDISDISTDGLVTEEALNEKGFLTEHQDLSEYARLTDIPTDYITEEVLETKGYLTEHQDISGKADVEHTHSYTELTDLPENLATEDFVLSEISKIDLSEIDIDTSNFVTQTELEAKGFLTEHQDLSNYATKSYVDEEINKIAVPDIDTSDLVTTTMLTEALAEKASNILFTSNKFVHNPLGTFEENDNLVGLTLAEIFAKLLGLTDSIITDPDIQNELINTIITNNLPICSVNQEGILAPSSFNIINSEVKPAEAGSGFYIVKDEQNNVIKAGYQDVSITNDELYYVIALPKDIDYNSMISLESYDPYTLTWVESGLTLYSDADTVNQLCSEAGIDISGIDTDIYTIWASEDICTGSILRYEFKEI